MAELHYLPQNDDGLDLLSFNFEAQPCLTYNLDTQKGCIKGMTDKESAVLQAVYLILNTERYCYPIYSHNYGVELAELIGQPKDYVMSEVKRRISEALLQDDRIESVDGFKFEWSKNSVTATFTVHTVYGDINTQKEMSL